MRAALKLALEALEAHADIGIKSDKAITAIKEALAQPEQEPVGMYRNKCADGSRCLHGCHTNESCFTSSQPQPEQEAVECDCNQGQSCHVCDPYFPFDSAPQTTRLTQKTTTNDVAIGVDVTEDGTHVTAMRMRPDGINIVIYSQFHPLAQPEQEPVAWRAWFDADNSAKWLFTLWPEEEHPSFDWQPLYTHPPVTTAQPEQEPVADLVLLDRAVIAQAIEALDSNRPTEWSAEAWLHSQATVALNVALNKPTATTPPQRTWVGLTEEEVETCFHHVDEAGIGLFDFADAIEAKLKEKNT